MRKFRTYRELDPATGSEILEQVQGQRDRLARRLEGVSRVVAVVSGKGGVGKSALTANVAVALARRGARVGALDADLHGPSLGRMLGVSGERLGDGPDGVEPARGVEGVKVISADLFLRDEDTPFQMGDAAPDSFVWQSPAETGVLREFLSDVVWGELDYLLIDVPPGTDKIARLLALVPQPDQVILVTTPSEIARRVVARSARMLREAGVETVGLVGNMTDAASSGANPEGDPSGTGPVQTLAAEAGLPVWGLIPFDPRLASSTDAGHPAVLHLPHIPAAEALERLTDQVDAGTLRAPNGAQTDVPTAPGPSSEG